MCRFRSIFSLIILFLGFIAPVSATASYIVIKASAFRLEVYDKAQTVLSSYSVGLAQNGMGKTKEGDKKTPLGEYRILWKASCFYKEDGGYPIAEDVGFIGRDNGYSYTWKEGSGSLLNDDYGGNEGVFLCLDYPNAQDQAKGYTGFGIAIHASLRGGIGECKSRGCIRLDPKDARALYKQVHTGTKVIITP